MFPSIFKIGFFDLRVYSLMYIIGILMVIFFSRRKAEKLGIKAIDMENFILFTFMFALVGARAYYVILRWEHYGSFFDMIAVWKGGLAIHGGLIGGFIGAITYCWWKNLDSFKMGDIIFPFLLIAQALGRFGNFANGEAHGVPTLVPPSIIFRSENIFPQFWAKTLQTAGLEDKPTSVSKLAEIASQSADGLAVSFMDKIYYIKEYFPWGVSFRDKIYTAAWQDFGNLPVHPTFFYEMILNFIGGAILLIFWKKDSNIGTGKIVGGYLIAYGIIRAVVTFFRADDLMIGLIRAPHLLSIIMVIAGLGFIAYARVREQKALRA
jgi:phosphatidylglycerol:prolipoprotein diacylglycerol transferase